MSGQANGPLISYLVNFDGADTVTVTIPDFFFEFTTLGLTSGGGRLSLKFLTREFAIYEVRFQQNLTDASTVIPFSTTPTGPSDQTSFVGTLDGIDAVIYVDRISSSGFYSIAMKVSEV